MWAFRISLRTEKKFKRNWRNLAKSQGAHVLYSNWRPTSQHAGVLNFELRHISCKVITEASWRMLRFLVCSAYKATRIGALMLKTTYRAFIFSLHPWWASKLLSQIRKFHRCANPQNTNLQILTINPQIANSQIFRTIAHLCLRTVLRVIFNDEHFILFLRACESFLFADHKKDWACKS